MILSSFHLEKWRLNRSVPMDRDAVEEARYHQAGRRMRFRKEVRLLVARVLTLLDVGVGKTGETNTSIYEMILGFADSSSFKNIHCTLSVLFRAAVAGSALSPGGG
jgi:hypothetical protein